MPKIRYKKWKCYFGVQDPRKELQAQKLTPTFRLILYMQKVSMVAWDMGEIVFCNEQYVGFTGNCQEKQRINYKDVGDGFLANSIFQDGYTWNFYIWIDPPPKHYIDQGYSPTHAHIMFLFDWLETKITLLG
jgi:hypothetical protein